MFLAHLPPRLEDPGVTTVVLVPLGGARKKEIEAIRSALIKTYRVSVSIGPRRALPKETYYPPNHRYRAEHLIDWLAKGGPGEKVIGVTNVDISTTARGHKDWGVVGLAGLGKRSGIVSCHRLKGDMTCFGDVAIHEMGHLFGRNHCPTKGCTMHDKSGHVAIGHVRTYLCPECRKALAEWLK